jgi:hypothetical protein
MTTSVPEERTVWPLTASSLLGLPVTTGDVVVGRVRDLVLDAERRRVAGFLVGDRGGGLHVLPWVAATVAHDAVRMSSPFALFSNGDVDFYLDTGVRLTAEGSTAAGLIVRQEGDVGRE